MSSIGWLLAALFLPLFPFSMVFNRLFARIDNTWLRIALLIGWPAAGLSILLATEATPPAWVAHWSVATALLYAFRALTLRDLPLWLGHIATSAWALLWLPIVFGDADTSLAPLLTAFSVPLVLLAWLTGHLEKTFGAAYAGALGGLAIDVPRLAGLLVVVVLAAIGTPLFPGFFALLGMVNDLLPAQPVTAVGVLLVWMLWAWAGMRILQRLVVGASDTRSRSDIGWLHAGALSATLVIFAVGGIWLSGSLV